MPNSKSSTGAYFVWQWYGQDPRGQQTSGAIRANTEAVARDRLRRQGIRVLRIKRRPTLWMGRVSQRDIALFTRHLATLLRARVPLLQAFDISSEATARPAMAALLLDIRADIESGVALAQACCRRPRYFDALFCHIIAAGEAAGTLDVLLERLASSREKTLFIRARIRAALIYPAIILLSSIAITVIILTVVLPAFRDLFMSLGAELPASTRFVLGLTDSLIAWRWWALAISAGSGIGLYQSWQCLPRWRAHCERYLLVLPAIGTVLRKAAIARWARTLATLLAAGVPLVEALKPAGNASGNQVFVQRTLSMVADLGHGKPLSIAMGRSQLFPNMVLQMVRIGEEIGLLDEMLDKISFFYESELNNLSEVAPSLIEPVVIVFLGILIGGLVLAMYWPILNMGQLV